MRMPGRRGSCNLRDHHANRHVHGTYWSNLVAVYSNFENSIKRIICFSKPTCMILGKNYCFSLFTPMKLEQIINNQVWFAVDW